MSKKQKDLFLKLEANNWFERKNKALDSIRAEEDLLLMEILYLIKLAEL